MSYGDHTLDRTAAWVSTVMGVCVLAIILSFAVNVWHTAELEAGFVKAGFCQVYIANAGYHWEKCK